MDLLLIGLYLLFSILACVNPEKKIKNSSLIFWGIILILVCTFRPETMPDYNNYKNSFVYNIGERFEVGYYLLRNIAKYLYNSHLTFFALFASIAIFIKLKAIQRLSSFFWLSMAIYISYIFILHDMIQIRVAVASGIFLASIGLIHDKKYFKYLLACGTAVLFHYSAIIFIPFIFLNPHKLNKKLLIITVIISYLLGMFYLSHIDLGFINETAENSIINRFAAHSTAMTKYKIGTEIDIFNWLQIVRIAIFVLIIYNIDKIKRFNKYVVILAKIYTIAIASVPLLSFLPVFAFRTSELLFTIEILLIPLLYYCFKNKIIKIGIPIMIGLGVLLINIYHVELIR